MIRVLLGSDVSVAVDEMQAVNLDNSADGAGGLEEPRDFALNEADFDESFSVE